MKILISISTYGEKNNKYLNQVIDEYKSFKKYDTDIIVNGTIPLERKDITFVTHKNPKNTAYFHRKEFFEKQDDYDFFLFSENDMLIFEDSIDLYAQYENKLPENYCLGFLRFENTPEKVKYLIDLWLNVHGYDFIKNQCISINDESFFIVTNPFQSSYILSRKKLKYVIKNSNYLTTGDEFASEVIESASSGIFTDWGFQTGVINKVIPLSKDSIKKCFIEHLPGNHCNPPGINASTPPEVFRRNCVTEQQLFERLGL